MPLARLLALLLFGFAVLLPLQSRAQLATTHPEHFSGATKESGTPNGGADLPDFRTPSTKSKVVLRRRQGLTESGNPSRGLSEACRAGDFQQVIDHKFIAVMDERIYGAAVGGTRGLHDPTGRAQNGVVYVFVGQGTTNCRVYQMGAVTGG